MRPTEWMYESESGEVIVRRYLAGSILAGSSRYVHVGPVAWMDSPQEVARRDRMRDTMRKLPGFWVRCVR